MKIVVVDGHALNPGDLSWQPLENFGEVTVYARTPQEQLVERCQDADIVLTNKARFDREILLQLTHLKYIGVMATGYDLIDLELGKIRIDHKHSRPKVVYQSKERFGIFCMKTEYIFVTSAL